MRLSAKEWHDHVSRQLESGLNPPEYCRRSGLSVANFYYWRQRLRKRERKSPLIPVVVKQLPSQNLRSLAIRLPNGIQIALEEIAPGLELRSIISCLMEVGREASA